MCERRLLARIHHYTVKRLRAEIEPVAARDFLRFLLSWQRLAPEARMEGPDALEGVVAQLQGFEAPAAAWESEILPGRLAGYEPAWLDDLCLAGRISWSRLRPRSNKQNGEGRASPMRTTPITFLVRRHAAMWVALSGVADAALPSPRALQVADFIRQNGASFFDEIMTGAGLLRSQAEEALAELVALGLVSSDSFAGLRALLVPSSERRPIASGRRRRRTVSFGMEDAGRWALGGGALARGRCQSARMQAAPRSNTSPALCSIATASCSGACSSARPNGCRHGATCWASIAGSKAAAKSAAGVLSLAFRVNSSRCPMRSERCARRGGGRQPAP